MECPICHAENTAESRFCAACGTSLYGECPNCQAENTVEAGFCVACGTSLTGSEPPLSVELAGRSSRLVAKFIDSLAFFFSGGALLLLAVFGLFLFPEGDDIDGDAAATALVVAGFVVWILAVPTVQSVLLSKDGQTIGKKAMGIRIVNASTGENGGFVPNVAVRGIVNGLLSIVPFYVLFDTLLIFRGDKRCIHDLIAGTHVVTA